MPTSISDEQLIPVFGYRSRGSLFHFYLYFMFYVLCFMFYVLCFMFYVLCFMFYVLCFMFFVLFVDFVLGRHFSNAALLQN